MFATLLTGDAKVVLQTQPDDYFQTCVTSPPYWNLRDYDNTDQIGFGDTPLQFVEKLCLVFDEVRRVLRNDGTCWVNMGDAYFPHDGPRVNNPVLGGLSVKNKELLGLPWRFAFAMQERGWFLRQDIIWSKPNPMPESVKDRCVRSHEYLFLFTKTDKYFFDWKAIAEPLTESSRLRLAQNINTQEGSKRAYGGTRVMKPVADESGLRRRRSVWEIAASKSRQNHAAVYPPGLVEPCIKAGSSSGDIVLDPFSGSGTTGDVALSLGRNYVGCDVNADYVEQSVVRLHDRHGLLATVAMKGE